MSTQTGAFKARSADVVVLRRAFAARPVRGSFSCQRALILQGATGVLSVGTARVRTYSTQGNSLPGFIRSCGSSARLMRRISSSSSGLL